MKLFGSVSSGATDNDDVALFLPLEYRPWSKAELLSNLCRDRDLPLGRQFRGCESHIRDITPVMSLVQAVAIALRASARRSRDGNAGRVLSAKRIRLQLRGSSAARSASAASRCWAASGHVRWKAPSISVGRNPQACPHTSFDQPAVGGEELSAESLCHSIQDGKAPSVANRSKAGRTSPVG